MDLDNKNGFVNLDKIDTICFLTFGHPASNCFPSVLLNNLIQKINQLSIDDTVSVVVLQSFGDKSFCAGASFDELLLVSNLEQGTAFFSGFANLVLAIKNCKKLMIARVQGKAVGGGVGIIAACDYVFATTNAFIKLSELAIGIGPFVIEPVVSKKIGQTAMYQLALNPLEWKSANWSLDKGLYSEVFDTIEEMDFAIKNYTQMISSINPPAIVALKEVFWQETEHWKTMLLERASVSGKLVLSDFTKKALAKFNK